MILFLSKILFFILFWRSNTQPRKPEVGITKQKINVLGFKEITHMD